MRPRSELRSARVDEYREKGVKIGLLKLRMFRPFPARQLVPVLSGRKGQVPDAGSRQRLRRDGPRPGGVVE